MKTFEEKFPNLKRWLNSHPESYLVDKIEYNWDCIPKEDVEQFCLDKQRVKEAILKSSANGESSMCEKYILLEELELND